MKKLITICLFMATAFTLNAQTFTTYSDYTERNGTGFAYKVTIRLSILRMAEKGTPNKAYKGTEYSVELVRVEVDKNKGWYERGKIYKCEQLEGICNTKTYTSISLQLKYNCQGKILESNPATFYNIGDKQTMAVQPTSVGGSPCDLPTASGIGFIRVEDNEIGRIIRSKMQKLENKKPANTSTTTTQNYGSNNPLGTNQSSTTQTTSQIPSLESQYEKLGIPANTPTYTKTEVYTQVATSLANELNASLERREARIEAEYKAKISAESDARTNKFNIEFLPLMKEAQKGNEKARMILFFSSEALGKGYYVKNRLQWLEEAIKNNNTDAIVYKASDLLPVKYNEGITLLEKAAALGSVDAMLTLAAWYDKVEYLYKSKNGGENEQKALEWYNKAAEAGSPKAMFYLGVIYKYGRTLGYMGNNFGSYKRRIKYNTTKDEKLSYDWFSKASVLSNYKKTPYARYKIEYFNSISDFPVNSFTPKIYEELAKIYKEGKVVPKDKKKAKEFETAAKTYKVNIENEAFLETQRYIINK